MKIKKNISLILGLSIPVLAIIFVAAIVYLPGLFIKPKFNFLYAIDNYYYYVVKNGKLAVNTHRSKYFTKYSEPRLFIYNIKKNESKEISFSQAQKFVLDPNNLSPDGFKIVCGHKSGNALFFIFPVLEKDCRQRFIQGRGISKKLNLSPSNPYNFQFLGWLINQNKYEFQRRK